MSAGPRIQRGFRRLGIAIAVPIGLIGIPLSLWSAYETADRAVGTAKQQRCINEKVAARAPKLPMKSANPFDQFDEWWTKDPVVAASIGCPGPQYSVFIEQPVPPPGFVLDSAVPSFWGNFTTHFGIYSGWTLIAAAIPLAFFMGIGWVIAGFARAQNEPE